MKESMFAFGLKGVGFFTVVCGLLCLFLLKGDVRWAYFISSLFGGLFWYAMGYVVQLLEYIAGVGKDEPAPKKPTPPRRNGW